MVARDLEVLDPIFRRVAHCEIRNHDVVESGLLRANLELHGGQCSRSGRRTAARNGDHHHQNEQADDDPDTDQKLLHCKNLPLPGEYEPALFWRAKLKPSIRPTNLERSSCGSLRAPAASSTC